MGNNNQKILTSVCCTCGRPYAFKICGMTTHKMEGEKPDVDSLEQDFTHGYCKICAYDLIIKDPIFDGLEMILSQIFEGQKYYQKK